MKLDFSGWGMMSQQAGEQSAGWKTQWAGSATEEERARFLKEEI